MTLLKTWTKFRTILSGKNTNILYNVKYKKFSYMKVHESVTVWYVNDDLHLVPAIPRDVKKLLRDNPNRFNVYKADLEKIIKELYKNNKNNPKEIINILSKDDSSLYPGIRMIK